MSRSDANSLAASLSRACRPSEAAGSVRQCRCHPPAGDWYVVGTRPDGSRMIIESLATEAKAQAWADLLRQGGIEGYTSITVEHSSQPASWWRQA